MTGFQRRQAERQVLAYDEEARHAGRAAFWWLAGSVFSSVLALAVHGEETGVLALLAFLSLTMAALTCTVMTVVFGFAAAVASLYHGRVCNKLAADRRAQMVAPAGAEVLES